MSLLDMNILETRREPCERIVAKLNFALVQQRLAELSDDDWADYMELRDAYRASGSEDEKREILDTMVEILLDEPATGIAIEDMEREARSDLKGAAAAERFDLEAQSFGRNLRRLRAKKGLSQSRLADLANMTQPQISYLERGEHRPQEVTVNKLAEALGVPAEELLPVV